MSTQPEQLTPLEDAAHWNLHRATFDAALAAGCHWVCSTEIAFLAVEAFTGQPGKYAAKPCAECAKKWQSKQQQKGQTL
jgi:hypothetical protein